MKSKLMKAVYLTLAFFFLGLGLLGVALPILPTTPFLLLATYFFAKGSQRFHDWFLSTKLYENYLEEFVTTRAMTLKRKLCIVLPVSAMLVTTAIFIDSVYARLGIALVMVFKYVYFFTQIRTIPREEIRVMSGVSAHEK